MTRIVSIGECMIELHGREADIWRQGFAGDTLNALWYMRALLDGDVACDYVSAFGEDPFSAEQIAFLNTNGIGTAHSAIVSGRVPGLYAVSLDDHGERSFTYWRNASAARELARDPESLRRSLDGASLVYFSGITLAILDPQSRQTLLAAIANARDNNAAVAFDPNYRPRLWPDTDTARSAIAEGYRAASIALPTFEDENALFGDNAPDTTVERVLASGPGEIVVKDGSGSALICHGGDIEAIAPPKTIEPVDTTGAGDSFNGAYLAARLRGRLPDKAALYAHGIAGIVIRHHGALVPAEQLALYRL
ncbi:sugar kinase [Oricola sp.]|uniref:sugar kinase n=1 Tax=Oricola sp. TaxID=1979950 RepID=UPI003BAA1E59